jgi:hypothetical protein
VVLYANTLDSEKMLILLVFLTIN